MSGGASRALGACARCHGAGDRPPLSALVPRLHGQPAEMLVEALRAFAAGERRSGIMEPLAAALSRRAAEEVATYYAGLAPLPPTSTVQAESIGRLAAEGDAAAEIPACISCHDRQALAIYPRLAAQSARYLENRLRVLWYAQPRTPTQSIMVPIARRLSEQQIRDLSAYFAGLPPEQR